MAGTISPRGVFFDKERIAHTVGNVERMDKVKTDKPESQPSKRNSLSDLIGLIREKTNKFFRGERRF